MKPKPSLISNQMTPGIVISLNGKIYRVESAVKVSVPKGIPFIKTKLRDLTSDEVVEKSFKEGQAVQEIALDERNLEFLYAEGTGYLFLDTGNLEMILVPQQIIGDKISYIKEGVEVRAMLYGSSIFSIQLPPFLELMVVKTEAGDKPAQVANAMKIAFLETGARLEVPLFVETGDVVKVDTTTNSYIQRI